MAMAISENKDVRWKQRFNNLNNAMSQFEKAVSEYEHLSDIGKEGLIQRFEYTYELFWLTMKDYLESEGIKSNFPRDVLKNAFHYEIIKDGDVWMDMLEKRNLLAHTYDEDNFKRALDLIINKYHNSLEQVFQYFIERI